MCRPLFYSMLAGIFLSWSLSVPAQRTAELRPATDAFQRMLLIPGEYILIDGEMINLPSFCLDEHKEAPGLKNRYLKGTKNIIVERRRPSKPTDTLTLTGALASWIRITGDTSSYTHLLLSKLNTNDTAIYVLMINGFPAVTGQGRTGIDSGLATLKAMNSNIQRVLQQIQNLRMAGVEEKYLGGIQEPINDSFIWPVLAKKLTPVEVANRAQAIEGRLIQFAQFHQAIGKSCETGTPLYDRMAGAFCWSLRYKIKEPFSYATFIPGIIDRLNQYEGRFIFPDSLQKKLLPCTGWLLTKFSPPLGTTTATALLVALQGDRGSRTPPIIPVHFQEPRDYFDLIEHIDCEKQVCVDTEEVVTTIDCEGFQLELTYNYKKGAKVDMGLSVGDGEVWMPLFRPSENPVSPPDQPSQALTRAIMILQHPDSATNLEHQFYLSPRELAYLYSTQQSADHTDSCQIRPKLCIGSNGFRSVSLLFEIKCGDQTIKLYTRGKVELEIEQNEHKYSTSFGK